MNHWAQWRKEWRDALRSPLYWLFWIVLGAAALASCGAAEESTEDTACIQLRASVCRFVDTEAGTVCWMYTRAYRGGISCLPIEQTDLGE